MITVNTLPAKTFLVAFAVILMSAVSSMAAVSTTGTPATGYTITIEEVSANFSNLQNANFSGPQVPSSFPAKYYPGTKETIIVKGKTGYKTDGILVVDINGTIGTLQLSDGSSTIGIVTLNDGVTLNVGILDAKIPSTNNQFNQINAVGTLKNGKLIYTTRNGAQYNTSGGTASPVVPLPVELISFNANKINATQVRLEWATAWEVNNRGFEVERSTNGVYWTNVGFVEGHGNSTSLLNYTFPISLADINTSMVYYRLKQVDFNGKFEYSPVRTVRLSGATAKTEGIYPNPAMNRISVNLGDVEAGNTAKVTIMDMTGKVILASEQMVEAGATALDMNIENLKTGNYIVNISTANTSYNTKLIKL